jgi:hypothetical protein
MTVLHRRTVPSRIAWHALWRRAADMRFKAGPQIPDLAVDFRHFVGPLQHLLQSALSSAFISPNFRLDLVSINRVDCVWVMAPRNQK